MCFVFKNSEEFKSERESSSFDARCRFAVFCTEVALGNPCVSSFFELSVTARPPNIRKIRAERY